MAQSSLDLKNNYLEFEIKISKAEVAVTETVLFEGDSKLSEIYRVAITKAPRLPVNSGRIIKLSLYRKQFPIPKAASEIRQQIENLVRQTQEALNASAAPSSEANKDFALNREQLRTRLQYLGQQIYQLFPEEIQTGLADAYLNALAQNKRLVIGLDLSEVPEFNRLPWELLFQPERNVHLALSDTTITRVIPNLTLPAANHLTYYARQDEPSVRRMLLVAVATQPEDAFYISQELEGIQQAFCELQKRGELKLDILGGVVTFDRFTTHLQKEGYDVIHFIGHGSWNDTTKSARLIFHANSPLEELEKDSQVMSYAQLAALGKIEVTQDDVRLALISSPMLPGLVILNSCQAGRISTEEEQAFSSMSAGLVKNGVPAVLALQSEVSQEVAVQFSKELHHSLAKKLDLTQAVVNARRSVYFASRHSSTLLAQWFVPVLYQATTLPPEELPWYWQVEEWFYQKVIQRLSERTLQGTFGLLTFITAAVIILQALVADLVPSDRAWQTLFLEQSFLQPVLAPSNPVWVNYVGKTIVPLLVLATIVPFLAGLWNYYDLRQAKIFKGLNPKERRYLLLSSYTGATFGFGIGFIFSYLLFSIPFYYLDLASLLTKPTQLVIRLLVVFIPVVASLLFARRLVLVNRSSAPIFRPFRGEKLVALIAGPSLFHLPLLVFLFWLPGLVLNRPWGGFAIVILLFGISLFEMRNSANKAD